MRNAIPVKSGFFRIESDRTATLPFSGLLVLLGIGLCITLKIAVRKNSNILYNRMGGLIIVIMVVGCSTQINHSS